MNEVIPAPAVAGALLESQKINIVNRGFGLPCFRTGRLVSANQRMQELIHPVFSPSPESILRLQPDRVIDFVVPIGDYEIASAPDRGTSNIVEDDDATSVKHLIYVEEVNQNVVERMPTIDEGEVNLLTAANQPRQELLRSLFVKLI